VVVGLVVECVWNERRIRCRFCVLGYSSDQSMACLTVFVGPNKRYLLT
jgi:hypothetical protein